MKAKLKINFFSILLIFSLYYGNAQTHDSTIYEYRNFNLNFLTTNYNTSRQIINKFSFNILGGYSGGVKGFELGSLYNWNKNYMHGIQIAGLINNVGNGTIGTQVAGLINSNHKSIKGFILAGICNYTNDTLKGLALSGIINLTGVNKKSDEIAGITNISKDAKNCIQIAGISNHALTGISKLQIAGIYNSTKINKGLQIGLINYADSSTGVSIGLLSFVKKGLHQLELSSDELFYTNVSFRTGTNKFYNTLNIGLDPTNFDNPLWTFGYGIGSSFKISNTLRSDVVLSLNHISKGDLLLSSSENYKLYWGIEKRIKQKLAIAFGPTFNLYIIDKTTLNKNSNYETIAPYSFYKSTSKNNSLINGWVGAKIAIRLL